MESIRVGRGGFTLIETAVWIAVLTILAVTVTPAVVGVVDTQRRDRAAELLGEIEAGAHLFPVKYDVYPGSVIQLLEPVQDGQTDLCGNTFRGNPGNRWEGPYVHAVSRPAGMPVAIGTAQPTFTYHVVNGEPLLRITVVDVEPEDAAGMDARFDLSDGATAGTYRWGAPDARGLVTVTYNTAVPAC